MIIPIKFQRYLSDSYKDMLIYQWKYSLFDNQKLGVWGGWFSIYMYMWKKHELFYKSVKKWKIRSMLRDHGY